MPPLSCHWFVAEDKEYISPPPGPASKSPFETHRHLRQVGCFFVFFSPRLTFARRFCSSLPELLEKKRLIDLHTNVATAVLDHIKVRNALEVPVAKRGAQVCPRVVFRAENWTSILSTKRN